MNHPLVVPVGGCRKPLIGSFPSVDEAKPDLLSPEQARYVAWYSIQNALCVASIEFDDIALCVVQRRHSRVPPYTTASIPLNPRRRCSLYRCSASSITGYASPAGRMSSTSTDFPSSCL